MLRERGVSGAPRLAAITCDAEFDIASKRQPPADPGLCP
jgi:hypothetical protein